MLPFDINVQIVCYNHGKSVAMPLNNDFIEFVQVM